MATSRAIITDKTEFIRHGYETTTRIPTMFYNGEDNPSTGHTLQVAGTAPTLTDLGLIGKGRIYNGTGFHKIKNVDLGAGIHYLSFWYKPDPRDLDYSLGNWRTLVTTRSSVNPATGNTSLPDRGIHLAVWTDATNIGDINARSYGEIGNDNQFSVAQRAKRVVAGTLYHIEMFYSNTILPGSSSRMLVYFNGELWVNGTTNVNLLDGTVRDITIGDRTIFTTPTTDKLYGSIDEVLYFSGANIPSDTERANYRANMLNKILMLDYSTEAGSIQLAKKADNTYAINSPVEWISRTIDITTPIGYYGRLQLTSTFDPAYHTINLYTQVSDDGIIFDAWQKVGSDGRINSAKKRYFKLKAELITTQNTTTPVLKELQILEYIKGEQLPLLNEPLKVYIDKTTGLEPLGILHNAYDLEIEEEVKAQDVLTFKIPMNDPKRISLGAEAVEYLLRIGNRRYILKQALDKKDSGGKKISEFKAEAKWYELNDNKFPDYELIEADVVEHVTTILAGAIPQTTWSLGLNVSTKTQKRTIRGKWKSALSLLRDVESTFGVELRFYYDPDTDRDLIDITDSIGDDKGIRFYYNKNIKEISRDIDTHGMVTRLYLKGAGELDISTINGGLPYIDNFDWVNKLDLKNKIRIDQFSDDRYTIPENLKEDGIIMLGEMSKPNINYSMSLLDLSSRSGHEPESVHLGDTVYPIDEDLMITNLPSRVMRWKYNIRQPWKTELELNQPKKQLADAQARAFDEDVQTLVESDPVSNADIQEMTVFNQLLNSRADDGLEGWTYSGSAGITSTTEGGFSGENTFKIVSNYDEYKYIYQDVFNISHRSTYTISAMVYKEGNITAGTNGFIGIRIRVKYKPDANGVVKEETKLLKIPDVTNL